MLLSSGFGFSFARVGCFLCAYFIVALFCIVVITLVIILGVLVCWLLRCGFGFDWWLLIGFSLACFVSLGLYLRFMLSFKIITF